ncbi:MAG: hypothetical protein GY866_37440 [Proteobacteria bacterium]|nr:hypothetical protein [Pseudomonadota bacterium]
MEDQEIYTVTIVRNIGIPISFTVRRRKILFFLVIFSLIVGFLLYGSAYFLILRSKTKNLATRLETSQKKVRILTDQLAKLDHDRAWKSEDIKAEEKSSVENAILTQSDFSTEGIWTTNKSTLSEEDLYEGAFVEIDRFNAVVKGDDLKITLKLVNSSRPLQAIGGYVCITLMNRDLSPPIYKSVTKGAIEEENGYPKTYKSGKHYLMKRRTSTIRLKFLLTEVNEYYTDAMVFLYSYKGRTLNKQDVALNKEIFLE